MRSKRTAKGEIQKEEVKLVLARKCGYGLRDIL